MRQAWNVVLWHTISRGLGRTQTGYCSLKFKRLKIFGATGQCSNPELLTSLANISSGRRTQGTLPGFIPMTLVANPLYQAWGFILNEALLSFSQVFWDLTGITWVSWVPDCQAKRLFPQDRCLCLIRKACLPVLASPRQLLSARQPGPGPQAISGLPDCNEC